MLSKYFCKQRRKIKNKKSTRHNKIDFDIRSSTRARTYGNRVVILCIKESLTLQYEYSTHISISHILADKAK